MLFAVAWRATFHLNLAKLSKFAPCGDLGVDFAPAVGCCRLQFITICGGKKSGTFFNVKIEQDDDDGTFEIDGETIKAKTTKALLNKFIKS